MIDLAASHEYKVGDVVTLPNWPRSRWEIWKDRVRQMKWDVPTTTEKRFVCTGTTTGAMWPEADETAR